MLSFIFAILLFVWVILTYKLIKGVVFHFKRYHKLKELGKLIDEHNTIAKEFIVLYPSMTKKEMKSLLFLMETAILAMRKENILLLQHLKIDLECFLVKLRERKSNNDNHLAQD